MILNIEAKKDNFISHSLILPNEAIKLGQKLPVNIQYAI